MSGKYADTHAGRIDGAGDMWNEIGQAKDGQ